MHPPFNPTHAPTHLGGQHLYFFLLPMSSSAASSFACDKLLSSSPQSGRKPFAPTPHSLSAGPPLKMLTLRARCMLLSSRVTELVSKVSKRDSSTVDWSVFIAEMLATVRGVTRVEPLERPLPPCTSPPAFFSPPTAWMFLPQTPPLPDSTNAILSLFCAIPFCILLLPPFHRSSQHLTTTSHARDPGALHPAACRFIP